MKNHIIKLSITFTLIQSLWAFGGFGMYGNTDMFTATAPATSSGNVTVTPQSMSGANAFGLFIYLDVYQLLCSSNNMNKQYLIMVSEITESSITLSFYIISDLKKGIIVSKF